MIEASTRWSSNLEAEFFIHRRLTLRSHLANYWCILTATTPAAS